MSGDQLTLVLLGAFWAGTSAVFTGAKNTNETRDKILTGKLGEKQLSISQLRRLLFFDWLPMKLSLASISLVLGAIIVMLPRLAGAEAQERGFSSVCYVASVVPFGGFVSFLVGAAVEYHLLQTSIRDCSDNSSNGSVV